MKLLLLAILSFIGNFLLANDSINEFSEPLNFDSVEDSLSIAKIITPNNDGINDALTFDLETSQADLSIYNRWGTLVYHSTANKSEWYGVTITGEDVVSGVYFYILRATLSNGESIVVNNSVSVVR